MKDMKKARKLLQEAYSELYSRSPEYEAESAILKVIEEIIERLEE